MHMAAEIDHVVLTRFNLPSEGVENIIRAKEGWLEHRIGLFERYCLASVRAQKCQLFSWIIYLDPESPEWLKRRIQHHALDGTFVPIFRPSVSPSELIADITDVAGRNGSHLMTTNLDNDDGLAHNFIHRLQAVKPQPEKMAVYLAKGLVKSHSRLYLRTDKYNAFGSVVDDWTSASTCWSDWHTLLGRSMRVLEIYDEPGWLQVVHGTNLSNRVRGRLVSPGQYSDLFPGLLDDVCEPKPIDMISDLALARPQRLVKESGRAIAKGVIIQTAGKKGLDRIKVLLASPRSR
jgi:hypothetical protein